MLLLNQTSQNLRFFMNFEPAAAAVNLHATIAHFPNGDSIFFVNCKLDLVTVHRLFQGIVPTCWTYILAINQCSQMRYLKRHLEYLPLAGYSIINYINSYFHWYQLCLIRNLKLRQLHFLLKILIF